MSRLFIFLAALALVVAACSSDDSGDTTTTTVDGGADESTTTADAPNTSSTSTTAAGVETTTTSEGGGGSTSGLVECVIGTWKLDSDGFFEAIREAAAQEGVDGFEAVSGEYLLTVSGDGTFKVEQIDWGFKVTSEFGDLELVVNSTSTGSWTIDGDVLTTMVDAAGETDIAILIDGESFEFPGGISPIEPPEAEFTGAVVSCDGDKLSATNPQDEIDFTSEWDRVG